MIVIQKVSENLSIQFDKTVDKFEIKFMQSPEEPNKPGILSGADIGAFISKMKMIYQMYRAWYKYRSKKA